MMNLSFWIKAFFCVFLEFSLHSFVVHATGFPIVDDMLAIPSVSVDDNASEVVSGKSIKMSPVVEKFYINDLKTLLKTLEDPIEHGKLIKQIRALIGLQKGVEEQVLNPVAETWENIVKEVKKAGNEIFHAVGLASEFPTVTKWFLMETKKDPWEKWGKPFLYITISALFGLFIGWFSKAILRNPQSYVSSMKIHQKHIFCLERILQVILWTIPYIVFAIFTYIFAVSLGISTAMESLLIDILIGGMIVRITHMSLKALLSPKYPHKRVVTLSDSFAQQLYIWLFKVTGWGMWFYFAILAMQDLGLPLKVTNLFNQILGLIITIQVIYFILHNRHPFSKFLERTFIPRKEYHERTHHKLLKTFSQMWYIPIITGVSFFYLAVFFGIGGGFRALMTQTGLSLGVFFIARLIVNVVSKYRKEQLSIVFSNSFPRIHSKLYHRIHILENVFSYVIYALAIYVQCRFWKIDLLSYIVDDQDNFFPFMKGIFKTGIILLVSYIIWITVDILIEKYIEKEDERAINEGHSMSARIRTLVPIIRKVLLFFLGAMVVFVFLSTLGVDTAPMLGGFALISVAISLGAQSFIKDILTGFFIILEDSVAVDDIVEIDGRKGEVEAVTIRSLRLRDDFGSVHTIPFGEVKILTNMTREYGYALVNLNLAYEDNIDEISEVIKKVGNDMMRDPVYGPLILAPVDIKGIEKFADSSVVLQCRLKTKPGTQFNVKREFHRYIKNEFDRIGIVMPIPQQMVYVQQLNDSSQSKKI